MFETKILQFLALAAFVLSLSEAYYPYGQQQYSNYHANYNSNQNSYNNINRNNINSNNNNYQNNDNYNNVNNNNNNIGGQNNNNYDTRSAHTSNPLFAIYLPKTYMGDFEYVPTRDGYRFSYQLIDGTRRTEVGFIPNPGPVYTPDKRATAERTELRMRARGNSKNRKLSPKSLQSLAG